MLFEMNVVLQEWSVAGRCMGVSVTVMAFMNLITIFASRYFMIAYGFFTYDSKGIGGEGLGLCRCDFRIG